MSRIEAQGPQGDTQEGQRLMIIELMRYKKIWELLIDTGTTGLQGHICNWDGGQRVSMAVVHMGKEETGM